MFHLTAQVGSMFAVYDDSDNSVEWYDKSQLNNFVKLGVVIDGYTTSSVRIKNTLLCAFNSCNWTKSKSNIFSVATRVSKSGDVLTIYAEGKKYKCKIFDYNNTFLFVRFFNGLNVNIPTDWVRQFL